ncbi:MAG: peptide deformylase [Clostridia bacterium]|nr:peptide deformylase [Clostridia bacterium]
MAILNILKEGEPTLSKISRPVEKITERTLTLLDDMAETMRRAEGVGLAAPQVGVLRRIVVVEVDPGHLIELINPEIIERSGTQTGLEGCLSVPGKHGTVTRPMKVKVRALDRTGKVREYEGEELLARCFCHEIDHLDGKLYTSIATDMEYVED